ncbi:hypothetical protein [Larsenimonas rhizosphaerae]|uniref:Uncharacterized protein n=1 Tax=Larsenimonas rhizosphaerae TaxID=2944682 RepID=A0AA41ZGL4_9GAMM|nr:hypothetical protein [Larsenimonas rhizosphaerae]MCX2524904.1 hypothetical protein [Larsenimonas rhizosphaerae]
MERIGAEALSEMVVDSASAPFIMGKLVGQALQGDAESRVTLQLVGEEIKAFAADPANYISESNRAQLARADALEQAGRLDDADRLRVRVALDNESMLMGAGGLLAHLPRLARSVSRSKLGHGVSGEGDKKTTGNPVVDAEKEALDRIAKKPKGPSLADKQPGTVLQAQSHKRMNDLIRDFSDKALLPKDFELTINGKVLKADPIVSKNAPVYVGATDDMVANYFMQLAGVEKLPSPKAITIRGQPSEVYSLVRSDGVKLNLRNGSSSAAETGAKWSIDIIGVAGIKAPKVEIKLK